MTTSEFTKSVIALACWRAAPTETHQTMLYIAMVFRNRALAGWYESDIYENCWRWLAETPGEFPDTREFHFQQLLAKLDSVTSGLVPDKTDGALYFAPIDTFEQIQGTVTTTVGKIIFVR